jgi:hypothetical protein
MKIEITKGRSADYIAVVRGDGSRVETSFPHKGPVPHDAVHWFVERGLGLQHGFWGMIAAGAHPEDLLEIAKAAGHASAKRAVVPDASIVELIQAERLVECFEAELWSGGSDDAGLLAMAEAGCEASHVPLPAMTPSALGGAREALGAFAADWIAAPVGHVARLDWG